jgi:hypothetical protein
MTHLLMIGTGKGLFLATSDDDQRSWRISEPPTFPMTGIYAVAIDQRQDPTRARR